jgi:hypothetical protein
MAKLPHIDLENHEHHGAQGDGQEPGAVGRQDHVDGQEPGAGSIARRTIRRVRRLSPSSRSRERRRTAYADAVPECAALGPGRGTWAAGAVPYFGSRSNRLLDQR